MLKFCSREKTGLLPGVTAVLRLQEQLLGDPMFLTLASEQLCERRGRVVHDAKVKLGMVMGTIEDIVMGSRKQGRYQGCLRSRDEESDTWHRKILMH